MSLLSPAAVAVPEIVLQVDTPVQRGYHRLSLSDGFENDGGFVLIIRDDRLSGFRTLELVPTAGNMFSVMENSQFLTTAFAEDGGVKIDPSFLIRN